jgi:hypothetical protein
MRCSRVIISVVLFLLLAQVASAQGPVAISRWNIGGGGGQVSGGSIAMLVSLGQAMAGPSSGGAVSVGAGFQGEGGRADTRPVTYLPLVMKSGH